MPHGIAQEGEFPAPTNMWTLTACLTQSEFGRRSNKLRYAVQYPQGYIHMISLTA